MSGISDMKARFASLASSLNSTNTTQQAVNDNTGTSCPDKTEVHNTLLAGKNALDDFAEAVFQAQTDMNAAVNQAASDMTVACI